MPRRYCSVSIDLDPLRCYYEIHGLGPAPSQLRHVILRRALPRFAEIFARRNLKATFFVVGEDLTGDESASGRAILREMAQSGHELGNHTMHHHYDLARRAAAEVASEVGEAHQRIGDVMGKAPVGFRAPGYDLSPSMMDALARHAYAYDSSMYPAPLYWLAKAAIMGAMKVMGRSSQAVLANPRGLTSPLMPYRPDMRAPWRRGQASIVELPISVVGRAVPVIGTSVLLAPTAVRAQLLESMRSRSFFNFELHGIDLVGADEDGIPAALVARQPDLRTPLITKRRALEATLDRLTPDFTFAPLREVANHVQRGTL